MAIRNCILPKPVVVCVDFAYTGKKEGAQQKGGAANAENDRNRNPGF